jgi:hypothetical protein
VSLDINKLEKVRKLANGVMQARCPACAEGGSDKTGEHLRIYADGRYGCCVHPKDTQHRKRIFALAGAVGTASKRRSFTVRAVTTQPMEAGRSILDALTDFPRTLRTGKSESVSSEKGSNGDFRTLRTPISNPRAYGREDSGNVHIYKDWEKGVLSVLSRDPSRQKLPFLTGDGTLSIPFDSPECYHWWKPDGKRLTVREIRAEVLAGGQQARGGEERKGAAVAGVAAMLGAGTEVR